MAEEYWQQNLFGGEERSSAVSSAQVPDEALTRRLARRDLNRSLLKGIVGSTRVGEVRGTPNEAFATERIMQPTSDFGVPAGDLVGGGQQSHFKPFANAAFQRLGTYKELPNDSFVSQQGEVDRRRVKELTADPSKGVNVRLPHEKPLVVHAMARVEEGAGSVREANVIVNGNHRIMSGIARGEMFSPSRVVEANEHNEEAAGTMQSSLEHGLPYAAHATQQLRYNNRAMTDDVYDRTKSFRDEERRNYRDAGSS